MSTIDALCCAVGNSTSIDQAIKLFSFACDTCKQTEANQLANKYFSLLLGPTQATSDVRVGLRSESTKMFVSRLQSVLGTKYVQLHKGLQLLWAIMPFLRVSESQAIQMQLVHLFVARHVYHKDLCDVCFQNRPRDCDYKDHPLFLGANAEFADYLSQWNLKLTDVEHLVVNGPRAVPFKFNYFVKHLDPLLAGNPFDAQMQKCYRHSVMFTHLCICSSLLDIYRQMFAKLRSLSFSFCWALEGAKQVCEVSDALVKFMINRIGVRMKANCSYNLKRFGVTGKLPVVVNLILNNQKLSVHVNNRGCMAVYY